MPTLSELLAARKANQPSPAPSTPTSPLSARLGRTTVAIPENEILGEFSKAPVTETEDLQRILRLPRRPRPSEVELDQLVAKWNARLGANPGPCDCETRFAHMPVPCINSLNHLQAWACEEFASEGGLLGKLAVGSGKTGLDALLAMCRDDVRVALLLVRAKLMEQFVKDDFPQWAAHFKVPNLKVPGLIGEYDEVHVPGRPTLYVYTYNSLSQPKNTNLLSQLNPDLVIADESHLLSRLESSRTKRFISHFKNTPHCKFVALSGSMNTTGIGDYAHHSALALRERSPLPIDPMTVAKWGKALDPAPPNGVPTPIGKLAVFANHGEDAVMGVGRRVLETRGVVASEESSVDVPLYIKTRQPPPIPEELAKMMQQTRATGARPDGEEAETAFQKAAWLKQLACGFYYFYRFPRMEPEELILEWFACKKNWNKEVRDKLENDFGEYRDSPKLLENAARRYYNGYKGPLPVWPAHNYQDWINIKDKVQPVQAVKWIDDHVQNDAVAWANDRKAAGEGGIIWCEFTEIGQRIAKALGVEYYNGGDQALVSLRQEDGSRVIVCSIRAFGTGVNLQKFNRALVVSNPADARAWEQLLGRLHRYGQTKPVTFEVYRHTPELRSALEKAYERALWIKKMDKCDQKLLLARKDW